MSTISECKSLIDHLDTPATTILCTLIFGSLLAIALFRLGRCPPGPFHPIQFRLCRLAVRVLYYDGPPTLQQIRALPLLGRIAVYLEYPDSFTNEGFGPLYICAVVDDYVLGEYHSNLISRHEFRANLRVKVGNAKNLSTRQRHYRPCDVGQTHFWLFCYHPKRRIVAEKLCHLSFLALAPRAYLDCPGPECPVARHIKYWWLKDLGGFSKVLECVDGVLTALGEPGLPRTDLPQAWMYQATPACSCCGNRQYHVWAAGERVTRPPPAHPSPLGTSASVWRNQSSRTLGGGCSIVAALALHRPPLCPSASAPRSQSSCAHLGRRPPHIRGRGAAPVLYVHDLVLHHGTLAPGHERLGMAKLKQLHPGPPPWPPSPSAARPCARTRVGVAKPKQLCAPGQTTPHIRGCNAVRVLCVHDLVLHHGTLALPSPSSSTAPGHERLGFTKPTQPRTRAE
ncbi:hypothetical protein K438DRAFT_1989559 [Mycena galopus ATCC 62051]|nr:hypothetical protein K438DRAFT_1989559 [Mycena galopus ATCC 62051]